MTVPTSALTTLPEQDYDAIRAQVRTGDIALCSGSQMFSRLIGWATSSAWTHCAIILRLEDIDRVMVLEAVDKVGVRAVPLSRFVLEDSGHHRPYPGQIVIARHREFTERADAAAIRSLSKFATDRLGAPFENSEFFKIFARIVAGKFGIRVPRVLQTDDDYICSEYVERCYAAIGIEIPWDGRGFIGPADIARDPALEPVARVARHPFPEDESKADPSTLASQ